MNPNPYVATALKALQANDFAGARREAQAGIAADPTNPELRHLAGLIECRAGNPERGIDDLRLATQAVPTNVAFRVMLARALIDAGRFAEAIAASEPDSDGRLPPPLWHARAEASDALERWDVSAEAWSAVASADPRDWRAFANAANALLRLERWSEAASALNRAISLETSEAALRFTLGAVLTRLDRVDEAIAAFRRGLSIAPESLSQRLTLARIYADSGDGVGATRELEAAAHLASSSNDPSARAQISLPLRDDGTGLALYVDPHDVDSVREIGRLFERTGRMENLRQLILEADAVGIDDEFLGYLRASLALHDGKVADAQRHLEGESPALDPLRWHRLSARIADKQGDPARAFAEAVKMNRSVADFDGWRRRGAAYRANVRDLAQRFDRTFAERIPRIARTARRSPAFLVGFPRSGTTLLDTFLMGHPGTQVLEEVHLLGAAEKVIGGFRALSDVTDDTLMKARAAYFKMLDEHVPPGFDGLVVDKMPLNMIGLPLIHALFPDAPIIFAQRHPADCVLSGFMQSFTLNDAMASFLDIGDAADLYDSVMTVFARGRDAVQLPVHTLIYESLVADPRSALKPVTDFLGLDWADELLDHQKTAKSRGVILTPSYDQVTRPLDRAPSGRWRRYKAEMANALPVLLDWARRLGYPAANGEKSQQPGKSTDD